MIEVSATEFKLNLGRYLDYVKTDDIWITRNGKTVAKMINPNVPAVDSISGILKGKVSENIDRHSLRDRGTDSGRAGAVQKDGRQRHGDRRRCLLHCGVRLQRHCDRVLYVPCGRTRTGDQILGKRRTTGHGNEKMR